MNIKKLILILFFLFLTFFSTTSVNAQVIFSDNFDDGDSDGWITPRNTCSSGWNVSLNQYGINTNGCITETIPESFSIDTDANYSFEVDIQMPSTLNDRNFVFKYKDNNNWYGIHTYGNTFFVQKVVNGTEYFLNNWSSNYNFIIGETYRFKIDVINNSYYRIYINNVLQSTVPDVSPYFDNYSAGLQASGNSQVWFDNVVITQLPSETPSPTPTASPSPTPTSESTPTATSNPTASPSATTVSLNVPSLKQYSQPWKNKTYDHIKATIEQFGCALTSAAMVLQYHGHNIMPDKLNDWLRNESDGYIRNGLVNWLAISRYTKLNDSNSSPTLEYKKLEPTNENLVNELENGRPAILKEPGHFVVAKSILPTTFGINDPGYPNRNDLTAYSNTFQAINSYTPTHSDLSYMMFVVNPNVNLKVYDSSNNLVNVQESIEEPISSLNNPSKKSGERLKVILFEKPDNGKYTLKVNGARGNYQLDSYLYNTSGKLSKNEFKGTLRGNDTDTFNISFDGKNKIKEKEDKRNLNHWFVFKYFSKFFDNRH